MRRLRIKNFRSVAEQNLELAPMTVVYGANGAGKSSLLYSLLTLKNIVITSNQATSGFFNYAFTSLGGFDSVVFNHRRAEKIGLGLDLEGPDQTLKFSVSLGENDGQFELAVERSGKPLINIQLGVPFPYPVNQQQQGTMEWEKHRYVVTWNGITAQIQPAPPTAQPTPQPAPEAATQAAAQQQAAIAARLQQLLNANVDLLRRVSVIPLRRGFTKPLYTVSAQTPLLITEDEVATLLANERFLPPLVSHYLEKVVGREFRVVAQIGTGVFSLQATDRLTGVAAELVNEGFGVNQLVYLLARCLPHDTELVCVEEPEIHLHPTTQLRTWPERNLGSQRPTCCV